jgi:hypothetical protein
LLPHPEEKRAYMHRQPVIRITSRSRPNNL